MTQANWTQKTINLDKIFFSLNSNSSNELKQFMDTIPSYKHVDELKVSTNSFKSFRADIEEMRKLVDDEQKFVILDLSNNFNPKEIEIIHWITSLYLGETIVQNEEGRHLVHIYDRDPSKRIKDGARYHQTHESGAIHTDNVNIPENYQYLLVGCVTPAKIGGENIIVSGKSVYDHLKNHAPEELKILMSPFTFEYRGISRELYEAPIITFSDKGEPLFRHLRTYMESAHNRANRPLTEDQVRALDTLDATLSMSEYQIVYKLKRGQILIANDSQILHDRRCFVDGKNTITFDDYKANINSTNEMKRTLLRTWVRKI